LLFLFELCSSFRFQPVYLYELFINPLRHPYTFSRTISLWIRNMNMVINVINDPIRGTRHGIQRRSLAWDWRAFCAVSGLAGGLVTVLVGCVLTATSWVSGTTAIGLSLHSVGAILLIMTIPLFACGAHFLDLWERKKSDWRKEGSKGGNR
jgi:hypothetical protein